MFDGTQPTFVDAHNGGPASPANTQFTFGPGPVSFSSSIVTSSNNGVTVTGSPGSGTGIDCSAAFVPLKSVLSASPI